MQLAENKKLTCAGNTCKNLLEIGASDSSSVNDVAGVTNNFD